MACVRNVWYKGVECVSKRSHIVQFVQKKTYVFVNLPTGYGKSLIYQALPFVYDSILEAAGHIVVVVSPLVNLMKDQVDKLANLGNSCRFSQ